MATTNHGLTVPTVGGSSDSWGTEGNLCWTTLDGRMPSLTGLKIDGTTALPFTGAQQFASGSVSAPGISFSADPDCGLYRIGANNIGLALNGVKQVDYTTTGVTFTGTLTATAGTFTTGTFTGLVLTPATASGGAGFRLPHGTAPSAPTNGDMWTTSSGVFARVNGTTKQLDAVATGVWSTPRNLSLTSDVTATLSSVDGSANVSAAATIANDAVTFAKMQNISTSRILGRTTASSGNIEELTAATVAGLIESSLDLSDMSIGTGTALGGYYKLGPLYVMWGTQVVTPAQSGTASEASVSYPVTLPNGTLAVQLTLGLSAGGIGSGINVVPYVVPSSFGTTGCTIGLDSDGSTGTNQTVYWLALGY